VRLNKKGIWKMLWIPIILAIVVLDQITKYLARTNIGTGKLIPVIEGFFYWACHENKGASWGILQGGRYFFIFTTIVACIIMGWFLLKSDNRLLRTSLTFIMGGAIGNLIDRVIKGSVTDFMDFYIWSYNFPTFNVADIFITMGTILLAYYMLFVYKVKEGEQ
jgi:signal peptidase II